MAPAMNVATLDVSATDSGVASNVAAAAAAQATVHGYTVAFWWAAAIFAVGAIVCGLLLRVLVELSELFGEIDLVVHVALHALG